MLVTFSDALQELGADAAVRLANAARPSSKYLFATLLPERNMSSYYVDAANIVIRATMAGLAAMDSPYPPGGAIDASTFLKESAKIANEVTLPEKVLRAIQEVLQRLMITGGASNEYIQNQALNFLNKVIIQAHMDTMEWLRGQALNYGLINWTFNKKKLEVRYGVPAANLFANRTGASAYGGSTSVFWDDVTLARRRLKQSLRVAIAHPDTIDVIVYNEANAVRVLNQENGAYTIQKMISQNGTNTPSSDARDTLTLVPYGEEGEKLLPGGDTENIPFQPRGKVLFVGENTTSDEYRVDEGSTEDPQSDLELGYTHIAPTVEGGGNPGRWAQLYTPQDRPWQLTGHGVTNGLPVIMAPEKIVVSSTEMPA